MFQVAEQRLHWQFTEFLLNFTDQHGLVLSGRAPGLARDDLRVLTSHFTQTSHSCMIQRTVSKCTGGRPQSLDSFCCTVDPFFWKESCVSSSRNKYLIQHELNTFYPRHWDVNIGQAHLDNVVNTDLVPQLQLPRLIWAWDKQSKFLSQGGRLFARCSLVSVAYCSISLCGFLSISSYTHGSRPTLAPDDF